MFANNAMRAKEAVYKELVSEGIRPDWMDIYQEGEFIKVKINKEKSDIVCNKNKFYSLKPRVDYKIYDLKLFGGA